MYVTSYEEQVRVELQTWRREMLKSPGLVERVAKGVQTRVNRFIPPKVHQALTVAVKGIVQTTLFGVDFLPKKPPQHGLSLQERDRMARECIRLYQKIAAAEGAGTGAGGILLGMADFPALIAIKMRCLFELAHIYGFNTREAAERLYLLYLFQLAFSSQEKRPALYLAVERWEETRNRLVRGSNYLENIDWEQFQQEYRDAIDFRKMLQLVPGIGAVVGAWANYGLLDDLGKTAINGYRLRFVPLGRG